MRTVYKVVRRLPDGRLVSAVTDSPKCQVTYVPGQPTKGKIGKLLAFCTCKDALGFLRVWVAKDRILELWKGEGKKTSKAHEISVSLSLRALTRFWKGSSYVFYDRPWTGTYFCGEIILTEKLEVEL